MKRHSITAILQKVQHLTVINYLYFGAPNHNNKRIRTAAVNEIIRLEAEKESSQKFICSSLKPVKD